MEPLWSFIIFTIIIIILVIICVSAFYSLKSKEISHGPDSIEKGYEILQVLGRGAFGTVFLAQNRYSGKYVAIKQQWRPAENEAGLMMYFNHAHIVRAFDRIQMHPESYIIMEYMPDCLEKRLERKGELSEKLTKLYFYQMCLAVEYLHEKGATHRDLKPDNMLLACKNDVTLLKISDFGVSHCCGGYMKNSAGDRRYEAPEASKGKYGPKVDIWSLGVVLLCCLTGKFPKLGSLKCFINSFNRDSISNELNNLIDCTLREDPARRSSIKTVLASSWLDDDRMKRTVVSLRQHFAI